MSVTADRIRGRSRVHREDTRGPVSDLAVVRERQRDEYGGTNWGAAFFGWLVAVGLGALLTAFVSAAGAAIAFSEFESLGDASSETETIGLVGGIALLAVAAIAYFAGGYVAGRMSRFDGRRQGLAVWIWGIVAIVVLAILGAIAGEEYNLFAALELPRIPIDEGDVTTGGVIALILIAIGTLLAAIAGGSAGEAYHRRVDRAGWDDSRVRERDETREADRDRRPQRA
jgi:MFS family permease